MRQTASESSKAAAAGDDAAAAAEVARGVVDVGRVGVAAVDAGAGAGIAGVGEMLKKSGAGNESWARPPWTRRPSLFFCSVGAGVGVGGTAAGAAGANVLKAPRHVAHRAARLHARPDVEPTPV